MSTSMTLSRRLSRLVAAAVPAVAVVLGGPAAQATGTTNTNIRSTLYGTACVYASTQEVGNRLLYDQGLFNNDGPSSVICPVERKNVYNTNGLADLEVRFQVQSLVFNAPVFCEAFSFRQDGSIAKMVHLLVNPPTDEARWFKVDFKNSLNVSDPYGYYNVHCNVPPSIYLQGVYMNEYGQ